MKKKYILIYVIVSFFGIFISQANNYSTSYFCLENRIENKVGNDFLYSFIKTTVNCKYFEKELRKVEIYDTLPTFDNIKIKILKKNGTNFDAVTIKGYSATDNELLISGKTDFLGRFQGIVPNGPINFIFKRTPYSTKLTHDFKKDTVYTITVTLTLFNLTPPEISFLPLSSLVFDNIFYSNDTILYKQFLERFPDSENTEIINSKIEKLVYNKTISENSIAQYKYFINKYPYSKFSEEINDAYDKKLFINAKNINTIEAYKNYIIDSPTKRNKQKAEQLAFKKTKSINTIAEYKKYIKIFPQSSYKHEAKILIKEIQLYEKAKDGTIRDCENYIFEFPNGQHLEQIKNAKYEKIKNLSKQIVKNTDLRSSSKIFAFSLNDQYFATADNIVKIYKFNDGKTTLLQTIEDNTQKINTIGFSADGKYFAIGSNDNTVGIYSIENNEFKLLKTITDFEYDIVSLSFSANENYLVVGIKDGDLFYYSVSNGLFNRINTINGDYDNLNVVKYSSTGKYIATGSDYGNVYIYSTRNGEMKEINFIETNYYEINSLDFSSDGKYLAIGTNNDSVSIYSIKNDNFSHFKNIYCGENDNVSSVCFSTDNKYLAVGTDNSVHIFSINNGNFSLEKELFDHSDEIISVGFSNSNNYFVSCSEDNTSIIYSVENNNFQKINVLDGHSFDINSINFSPNNKYLVSASNNGLLKIYSVGEDKIELIQTLNNHNEKSIVAGFSYNGKYLVSASYDNTAIVYSTGSEQFEIIDTLTPTKDEILVLGFSADNKYLALGIENDFVKIYSIENGKFNISKVIYDSKSVSSLSFSHDNMFLATVVSTEDKINFYKINDGQFNLYKTINYLDDIYSVSFSHDNKFFAIAHEKYVSIYSRNHNEINFLKKISEHDKIVTSVNFSADGKYFSITSYDNTISVYYISGNNFILLKTIDNHKDNVFCSSFSNNGLYLATGGKDGAIVYRLKQNIYPAILEIVERKFIDDNNDSILNAGENARILITITNKGKGKAFDFQAELDIKDDDYLTYTNPNKITIAPGETRTVIISIKTTMDLQTKLLNFTVNFKELNNTPPPSINFKILTKEFPKPNIYISNYSGNLIKRQVSSVKIKIVNNGKGEAENVRVKLDLPSNIIATDNSFFNIGTLKADSSFIINCDFLVKANFSSDSAKINAHILEKHNRFAQNKTMFFNVDTNKQNNIIDNTKPIFDIVKPTNKYIKTSDSVIQFIGQILNFNNLKYLKINNVEVEIDSVGKFSSNLNLKIGNNSIVISAVNNNNKEYKQIYQINREMYFVNVDIDIPIIDKKYKNRYALIISNENYKYLASLEDSYTMHDGLIFKEYANKTLGIPENNIYLIQDGNDDSFNPKMPVEYKKILNILDTNSEVFVFYSGHGIVVNKKAYFLPVNANVQVENNNYTVVNGKEINELLDEISAKNPKQIIVFVDACFTGTSKNGNSIMQNGGRNGIHRVDNGELKLPLNTIYFSATSNDKLAYAFDEKKHGLFTYLLLKTLQDSKGKICYEELFIQIKKSMKQIINAPNSAFNDEQIPTIITNPPSLKDNLINY